MNLRLFIMMVMGLTFAFSTFVFADEEKEVQVQIPATVSGIWQEVKDQEGQLDKTISDKKLDKVHHFAFAIRDLVNALPDKSTTLQAEGLSKVKSYAKYIADIASRLDESGDANDQAGTEANFGKLQGLLKSIEAQYSPDELKEKSS